MEKTKASRVMTCPWCNKRRVTHFSVLGSEADGFTVARRYTSCENCMYKLTSEYPKLTSECPSRIKILRLDLSTVDREFKNAIDRKQMTEFIKNVLGR